MLVCLTFTRKLAGWVCNGLVMFSFFIQANSRKKRLSMLFNNPSEVDTTPTDSDDFDDPQFLSSLRVLRQLLNSGYTFCDSFNHLNNYVEEEDVESVDNEDQSA